MDLIGIMPDVRVRKNEPDPLDFARRYLKSSPAAQTQQKPK